MESCALFEMSGIQFSVDALMNKIGIMQRSNLNSLYISFVVENAICINTRENKKTMQLCVSKTL